MFFRRRAWLSDGTENALQTKPGFMSKLLGVASIPQARDSAIEKSFLQERRTRARTEVHWPVLLLRDHGVNAIETITENLSSSGFYCLSTVPVMPGESLRCSLRVPAHDPKGEERMVMLECSVQVLRTEATSEGSFGIACRIEDYHLITNGS